LSRDVRHSGDKLLSFGSEAMATLDQISSFWESMWRMSSTFSDSTLKKDFVAGRGRPGQVASTGFFFSLYIKPRSRRFRPALRFQAQPGAR
jgi:hypothetical protein